MPIGYHTVMEKGHRAARAQGRGRRCQSQGEADKLEAAAYKRQQEMRTFAQSCPRRLRAGSEAIVSQAVGRQTVVKVKAGEAGRGLLLKTLWELRSHPGDNKEL